MTAPTLTPPPREHGALADTPHNRIMYLLNLWKHWGLGEQNKLLRDLKDQGWTEEEIERSIAAHWSSGEETREGFEKSRAKPTVGRLGKMRQEMIAERNRKSQNEYNRTHYSSAALIANQSKRGAEHFANIRGILAGVKTRHMGGHKTGDVVRFENLPDVPLKPTATRI